MRILIIEDELFIAKEIRRYLEKENFTCNIAQDGKTAIELMARQHYDLFLLDLKLPDLDGFELLRKTVSIRNNEGIIIISARSDPDDKVEGLNIGADDYISKPFSLPEIKSRILAVMRRRNGLTSNFVKINDLEIDLDKRQVTFQKEQIPLTRKEYEILSILILNKNKVVSRPLISEAIWGENHDEKYNSNFIDVHVKNLRKKLKNAGENLLETIRGVGFKLNEVYFPPKYPF